jgi:hypothetical protein
MVEVSSFKRGQQSRCSFYLKTETNLVSSYFEYLTIDEVQKLGDSEGGFRTVFTSPVYMFVSLSE